MSFRRKLRYPTRRDLARLRGRIAADRTSGADTLKQLYLWRQDDWNAIPQALVTAALSFLGTVVLSLLKTTELKADSGWI
jgi:hypothetical protein